MVCSFIHRQLRLPLLIKLCGCLCLVCAVLCVVVTVTTTVLHMNRLQTLHECEYLPDAASCTCTPYAGIAGPGQHNERYVFSHVRSCLVIHGPLYACLRAMFGLSVIGILVSIFSCMLVYQLLSHEKKKMYWSQLESRRRQLYRRPYALTSPGSGDLTRDGGEALSAITATTRLAPDCVCCSDDYGFPTSITQEALYPYALWDTIDERCWSSGVLSPEADTPGGNGARSLLLHLHHPSYAAGGCVEDGVRQHPHHSGVLLRPFMSRGLEGRLGFRHPRGSRPLSDPGVALHLPPYPPPSFPEAFMPMGYPDAFPGYLWGPPPPYSQPTSTENIANVTTMAGESMSPSRGGDTAPSGLRHEGSSVLMSPAHRPPTLADLMRGPASPPGRGLTMSGLAISHEAQDVTSPSRPLGRPPRARHKKKWDVIPSSEGDVVDSTSHGTNSLPHRHRDKKLTLGQVKSLDDVTEHKRDERVDTIFCDSKDINSFAKIQREINIDKPGSKHLKSVSDPKSVYSTGKMDPESEIYFADVSSCVSIRPDSEEVMYYSDPTSSGSHQYSMQRQIYIDPSNTYPDNLTSSRASSNVYELVREASEDDEDVGSHHTSDDTMIVHTSSSSPSLTGDTEAGDTENTYSVISPATEPLSVESSVGMEVDGGPCNTSSSPTHPVFERTDSTCSAKTNNVSVNNVINEDSRNANEEKLIIGNLSPSTSEETVTSSISNLNLHHPLHPVHHAHHQAFHHHLTHHHHSMDASLTSIGIGRKKRSKRHEPRNEKCSSKRCSKAKLMKPSEEPLHEVVHDSTSRDSSLTLEAKTPAKHKLDSTFPSKPYSTDKPTMKLKQHRLRKHHPNHHHHHSDVPLQSSSSSSSTSLPYPDMAKPEQLQDPNGNVSKPATNCHLLDVNSVTVAEEKTSQKSTSGMGSSKKNVPTSNENSKSNPSNSSNIFSKKPSSDSKGITSPIRKPRSNLSLPLRKLSAATVASEAPTISSAAKRTPEAMVEDKNNISPSKDRETRKKRCSEKAKGAQKSCTQANITREISSDDLIATKDLKSDSRQSTNSEADSNFFKRTRRLKPEVAITKAVVTQELNTAPLAQQPPVSVSALLDDSNVASDEPGHPTPASLVPQQDEVPDSARRAPNVHHLLQNLKSVNV
ncbi:uncharacterized protein LOC108673573 [Hyalella azteca]|uniref:Uncharacterized protein LOC108673573 n=1 Tax=Hyalella azteca TaxID=294128 RepID=A0A8B7NT70_HYAAZ|nr:uncharacterized protein LOC108673573 [Hyalella azteca]